MAAASDLRDALMPFVGKSIGATLTTTDSTIMVRAVNKALMELLQDRRMENRTELVRAPVSVTLEAVTEDSKDITFSGFASWMAGCSINIGSTWNRLVKPGSSVSLETPYSADTAASVAATVYQDAVNLDYAIDAPNDPVSLDDGLYPISMLGHESQLSALRRTQNGNPQPGLPRFALINDALSLNATPATRFEFEVPPVARHTLHFNARLRPVQIADWNDSTPFLLPGGRDLEILEPVARFHLSSYPIFIGDRGEAREDYTAAMQKWAAYTNKGSQPAELDTHGC